MQLEECIAKFLTEAKNYCEDHDNKREQGLIFHVLLTLLTENCGGESFDSLSDTAAREHFGSLYEELESRHMDNDFDLIDNLSYLKSLLNNDGFISVSEGLPMERILFAFVECWTESNTPFLMTSFLETLERINNRVCEFECAAEWHEISFPLAKEVLMQCEKSIDGFNIFLWKWHFDIVDEKVENLKQTLDV
jgi:hypothetical protein